MNDSIDRDDLQRRFDHARDDLLAVVAKLSNADLAETVAGERWTIRETLDHLEAWDAFAVSALRDLLEGGHPVYPADVNAYNAASVAARRDRSPTETRDALNVARRELRAMLDAAPDHRWVSVGGANAVSLPGLVHDLAEHDEEHTSELRAWRAHAATRPETG